MSAKKLQFISIALASSLAFVTGCQTLDPYTGEKKTSSAVKYGAIGAAICGIIGSRDSGKHARNAAVGCGVIGASIGAYMDSQESKLRESLQNTGVSVQREGDQIRLIMPGNITFATNKSHVQSDFYPVLDSVVTVLKEFDETIVEVQGFTDSTGSWEHNMKLSESRARAVAGYLESGGIIYQRLVTSGKGPSNPIASNSDAAGRAQNRRVEIRLRAIEAQG
ncbi:OmpA family protein [Aliikangiella coralliicola]|uniref:OmpA family protein n=1 Tax=Aliikangiella coralliicola TaxID=2592383 RepID=A0A545U0C5_9GAMM|nr:OmpA family protein [Aliikangiella coralliicola]TQV82914.1 OmpA family protein [Aliikangiella coralliicola]